MEAAKEEREVENQPEDGIQIGISTKNYFWNRIIFCNR